MQWISQTPLSFGRFAVGAFLDAHRPDTVLILLTPLNKTATERKRGVKRICDGVGRASLGLDGTLGFRSMSLALMAATWAVYHLVPSTAFIAARSPSFSLFPSPLLLPLFLSLSSSLFLYFIYLFFWAGGRSLSLGAPAGWLPGCRWTLLLRILLLSKQQRSTTSSPGVHTVTYQD